MLYLLQRFDESRNVWTDGLRCVANLDALLSLAVVSSAPGYVWPEMISRSKHPYGISPEGTRSVTLTGPELDIQGGRHPMLEFTMAQR